MAQEAEDQVSGPVFKVWVQVERCDDEMDEYTDLGEPELAKVFVNEDEAHEFAAGLCAQETKMARDFNAKNVPAPDVNDFDPDEYDEPEYEPDEEQVMMPAGTQIDIAVVFDQPVEEDDLRTAVEDMKEEAWQTDGARVTKAQITLPDGTKKDLMP